MQLRTLQEAPPLHPLRQAQPGPCDDPLTCGIHGTTESLCPNCRDWEEYQQLIFKEREATADLLKNFRIMARVHPHQLAEILLPVLAEGMGEISAAIAKEELRHD